jgi:hypothetical protein
MAAGALAARLADGDVQATEADRLAAVGEAAHVADLGPDADGDAIAPLEGLAARLAAGDPRQVGVEPVKFALKVVDHPQGQLDRLAGHPRQLDQAHPSAVSSWARSGSPWWTKMAWMR